ncbi:MAG: sulfurtransferase complex subunit TusC [Gammaproteobacteria bacterium]
MKKVLIFSHNSPYDGIEAEEALDFALATASLEQEVSLVFIDDGIYQLLAQQYPEKIMRRHHGKMIKLLEVYGVKNIYADDASIKRLNFDRYPFVIGFKRLAPEEIQPLTQSHDVVMHF